MTTAISIVGEVKGLSKKELGILVYLRSNARHTVTQIGRKLGIPRTTVFEKIKKFKKLGLVPKFTAIVDFNRLGLSICAYVLFKTTPDQKEAFGEALAKSMHTNNVSKLGNDFDYMASLVFENMNDLHNFLDLLTQKYGIKETKIMYITQDMKREGVFAQYQKPEEMESSVEEEAEEL
jgi:DNA-binding Lrp family transcriptional regulator